MQNVQGFKLETNEGFHCLWEFSHNPVSQTNKDSFSTPPFISRNGFNFQENFVQDKISSLGGTQISFSCTNTGLNSGTWMLPPVHVRLCLWTLVLWCLALYSFFSLRLHTLSYFSPWEGKKNLHLQSQSLKNFVYFFVFCVRCYMHTSLKGPQL